MNINLNVNDLTIDNMIRWPKLVQIGLISFLSLLLALLGYWLIVIPNFDEYSSLQQEEVKLKSDFELKQRQASNLNAYRNQMATMEERFGKMLRELPSQNEMPGLLEDISKTGVTSGLTFELFAPLPEVQHDFYVELPIKIIVVGTYHQFAVFLSRVVQMGRIVTLHDFIIENVTDDQGKKNPNVPKGLLRMQITAKIYRYRTR